MTLFSFKRWPVIWAKEPALSKKQEMSSTEGAEALTSSAYACGQVSALSCSAKRRNIAIKRLSSTTEIGHPCTMPRSLLMAEPKPLGCLKKRTSLPYRSERQLTKKSGKPKCLAKGSMIS
jgi:hypothetical protein